MPCREVLNVMFICPGQCLQFLTAPDYVVICGWYRPTGGVDQRLCNVCNALVGWQTCKLVGVVLEWLTCAHLTVSVCMR